MISLHEGQVVAGDSRDLDRHDVAMLTQLLVHNVASCGSFRASDLRECQTKAKEFGKRGDELAVSLNRKEELTRARLGVKGHL